MDFSRMFRHITSTRSRVRRYFPAPVLSAIKAAIGQSESRHSGEILFAVEAALEPLQAAHGMTPRERALEVFSNLRLWDTEHNNGVLIYVLMADHAIEIIADRGIDARVGEAGWRHIADAMQRAFAARDIEAGAVACIAAVSRELEAHFPSSASNANELADDVRLL
ncbi:TPM domain-containing protein [Oxalobacteraceae bacterium]|nr:TPM domain-containing protein [Oxalobacteraceae bacterium]